MKLEHYASVAMCDFSSVCETSCLCKRISISTTLDFVRPKYIINSDCV